MNKKRKMGKNGLLLVAICMTMGILSSCSNEMIRPTENTGSLKLTIKGSTSTRASSASLPTQSTENTVNVVTIGLFDHSSHATTSITEGKLTKNGDGSTSITVSNVPTGTTQDVVVVANAPEKTFAGLTTLDAFLAQTLSLTQKSDNLPMSGENVTGINIEAGSTAEADVTILRLVARVQLTSVSTDFSPAGLYANASFKLDSVFVYNGNSISAVGILSSGNKLLTSTPLHGYGVIGSDGKVIAANSDFCDALSPLQPILSTAYTANYYYYTFENYYPKGINDDNKISATKLVLSGMFCPDVVNAPNKTYKVYYPVVINRSQTGTDINNSNVKNMGIQRNNIYSISAVITGMGVSDPTKFMEPANLNVKVTISDWNLTVSQMVNF